MNRQCWNEVEARLTDKAKTIFRVDAKRPVKDRPKGKIRFSGGDHRRTITRWFLAVSRVNFTGEALKALIPYIYTPPN